MPRVHKDYREGLCSRFTNESKFTNDSFWREDSMVKTNDDNCRKMTLGKRILLDLRKK